MSLFEVEFDQNPYIRTGDKLREIAFPLGGIGTGCVSLDGRGGLRDWEIYGRPNKGCVLEYTFPALWFQEQGQPSRCMTLLGPRLKYWTGETRKTWDYGHGRFFNQMDGLRGFDSVEFNGTFPFARVSFQRADVPLEIELEAFNPFIPLDVPASSFPGLYLVYRVSNRSDRPIEATIAWSMMNPVGEGSPTNPDQPNKAFNERFQVGDMTGIRFTNARFEPQSEQFGEVVLATNWPEAELGERWPTEGWWDSLRAFWNGFRSAGRLSNLATPQDQNRVPGTLGCRLRLQPGEAAEIPFVIAWRFPNALKYWGKPQAERLKWTPHYAVEWESAVSAASALLERRTELRSRTAKFEGALYGGSQPVEILESVGATLSVLHTPTLIRLSDGQFWAWEGCSATEGCCEGTCSHVWNYALAHVYLFPEIQRSFLDTAFAHTFNCGPQGQLGAMNFRVPLPLAEESPLWHAASDGQLGQIVQIFRDWRLTGDSEWLRSIYPLVKKALGYAWIQWDRDRDGLVEGDMHNTYDINFCTPNPLTQFFYLAALRAMERMAREVGDALFSSECGRLASEGSQLTTERLWTGDFFRQSGDFTDPSAPRYQHGAGCLSDQLFGQLSADIAGLGDLVDPELIRSALLSIFRHNFRSPLGDHENLQRVYAVSDEAGLLLCSWPDGEMPAYPFVYSDEVWTGIEYQVATHLALIGEFGSCEAILKGIRARYDGARRNPWNEFECGSHYARALAAYGLILAYSGMRFDSLEQTLTFRPEPFKSFWSLPTAWGTAERLSSGELSIQVVEGTLQTPDARNLYFSSRRNPEG
jgi:non-lysosomal glucosylceramidase